MYNMDVGEHYYAPMTNYLEAERGTRGETPGALTFDERLSKSWLNGRRYEATEARERYARCSSLAREDNGSGGFMPSALRQARAASVDATASRAQASRAQSSATASRQQQVATATSMSASRQQASSQQSSVKSSKVEETSVQQKQSSASSTSVIEAIKQRQEARLTASKKVEASSKASAASSQGVTIASHRSYWKAEDDVSKKIADIHITPFDKGQEMNDANAASARARARILELEKELEVITQKAMTTQVQALKTAKQMAAEAYADEANMTSSVKKSKKVMIESSAKVN